jgi:glycosyltransferase involved in cell wall biosynthesis
VESEGCGRWFANGDAEGLAAWILELKANPSHAVEFGNYSRRLLERTATPEIVTTQYLQLIQQHLPEHKQLETPSSTMT